MDFTNVSLKGANLTAAYLNNCNFTDADLSNVLLCYASLQNAKFIRTNFKDVVIDVLPVIEQDE